MELVEVVWKPRFSVEFTFEEINELFTASHSHYDARCRSLSAEFTTAGIGYGYTQHGYSFLTGLKNRTTNGTAEKPGIVRANNVHFEILDTLCKIAESPLVSRKTGEMLWTLLKRYNSEFDRINGA